MWSSLKWDGFVIVIKGWAFRQSLCFCGVKIGRLERKTFSYIAFDFLWSTSIEYIFFKIKGVKKYARNHLCSILVRVSYLDAHDHRIVPQKIGSEFIKSDAWNKKLDFKINQYWNNEKKSSKNFRNSLIFYTVQKFEVKCRSLKSFKDGRP